MINQDCCSNIYKSMLENMQDGFMHFKALEQSNKISLDFQVIEINKSFKEKLKISDYDIKGKRFSELLSVNQRTDLYFRALSEQLNAGSVQESSELYDPFSKKWYSLSFFNGGNGEYTVQIKDETDAVIFREQKRIYNNITDFFSNVDFQGNFISHNQSWEKVLGYTKEELESKRLWDLLYISEQEIAAIINEDELSKKKAISFEAPCMHKNGSQIWLQFNIYPIIEKKLLYAVARDITKRKTIEEQLRESEQRWQFALEGSDSGVWDWDIEENKQLYSKAWKGMLGYEEHEISSDINEWESRVHPEDIMYAKKMTEDYLNGVIPVYNCEHRLRCKDGQYKWILSRAKIVKRSPEGKPLRMTGIHTDITELKNLLEELKELTNHYEIVFNGTQDALFLVEVSDDGRLLYSRLNNSHEKLTGFTTEQVKGKTPIEVLGKKTGRKVEAAYNRCVKKKQTIRYEERMELPTGDKVWYTRLSPVIKDGRVAYIVGSSRDVTEQKSIEESKRKADDEIRHLNESIAYENLKTEFFSNLSHELRTPLNVILCSVQLTNLLVGNSKDESLKGSLSRNMRIMKQNSYRLLRLVNNLIDITKIDSGYFSLSLQNKDIVELLKEIVMSIETYAQNKSIKLFFESEIQQREMAIDPDKLERIILNLFSNAVKFTQAGGQISVRLYENSDRFFISVKDTGIGIPEEKLDIIFNRFTQVDKSLARGQEGSGIGLALVKSLVELHGGKVKVESEFGKGSEFVVEIPISLVDEMPNENYKQIKIKTDVVERIDIEFSDIYA